VPAGPEIPEWADPRELDASIRDALRGLDARNAAQVAGHLVVAGTLVDDDPQTALAHARAARDRASRLAVVREAVGVAAYHAEDYAEAARELRAYRRMSGDQGYRAVLADCERAMGRPEVALRLVSEALAENPDAEETVELRLVEAGARRDLGEDAAARIVLESALGGRPDPERLDAEDEGQLRIAAAYADLLRAQGDEEKADQWLAAVAAIDPELAGEDLGIEFTDLEELSDFEEDVDADSDEVQQVADEEVVPVEFSDEAVAPGAVEDVEEEADHAVPAASTMSFDEEVEAEVAELLGEADTDAGDSKD
jgi:tetratricopeptide (TPR) repeat protein